MGTRGKGWEAGKGPDLELMFQSRMDDLQGGTDEKTEVRWPNLQRTSNYSGQ